MKVKKGLNLASGAGAVLMLVLIAVTAVVGVKIANQLQTGETAGGHIYLAAENVTVGIQAITSQMSLIGLIIVMAIVIGLLWGAFGGMLGGGGV